MHFHRDLLIIADGYAKEILQVTEDIFAGSPPLAFTFGLGGRDFSVAIWRDGGASENASPANMIERSGPIRRPSFHRADSLSGDACRDGRWGKSFFGAHMVSAGETLPAGVQG